jgi:hypothetical protein
MIFLISLNMVTSSFPCTYLGLPLHYKKPTRSMMEPVIMKIGNRLSGWKRRLLSYLGRELLVKTILSDMPTYFLTVHKMPGWAFYQINKFRKSFLWRGKNHGQVKGGHCLVNWQTCLRPTKWGRVGH